MQPTVASLKSNPLEGGVERVITKRGGTSRAGPLETSNEGRTPRSTPTLNPSFKETRVRWAHHKDILATSAFDLDAPRDKVEGERTSALERLAKGSDVEEPPLFGPTLSSKTIMTIRKSPSQVLGLFFSASAQQQKTLRKGSKHRTMGTKVFSVFKQELFLRMIDVYPVPLIVADGKRNHAEAGRRTCVLIIEGYEATQKVKCPMKRGPRSVARVKRHMVQGYSSTEMHTQ
ncbi:hypothetical protein AMTR_s00043p00067110 [Amborella trichopoda]|uniref:Uncharacterized protein n=1 Tax=Amborella trichopoda TaxID=13333 RepID=W1PYX3_AMBTC|nr:hypothetical protein AMTR_s00043p00067110 [Amborella trichopoda]